MSGDRDIKHTRFRISHLDSGSEDSDTIDEQRHKQALNKNPSVQAAVGVC